MFETILLISLVFSVVGLMAFFRYAPQLGGKPQGDRMGRMQSAKNYRGGRFYNTVPTMMNLKSSKMLQVMWKFIFKRKNREPARVIHVEKFDADTFLNSDSGQVTFSWFGHSSLLIRIDDKIILIDPVFSKRASMFSFMGPKRFPYTDYMDTNRLPPIDAVLISHDHYDHLDYRTIQKLANTVSRFYVPLNVGTHLEKWGVPAENMIELNWGESVDFETLRLVLTPSRHFSGRGLNNRYTTLWGSWVVLGKENRLFFGGDSGYFPGFKEIGNQYGPFDLTFLECGAYNENWHDIHMMPEETVQAHIDLKGKLLMPIHWGKFSLSLHPWKEPIERAVRKGKKLNVALVTPRIGEVVVLTKDLHTSAWWEDYD